jgi:hypothetical protein
MLDLKFSQQKKKSLAFWNVMSCAMEEIYKRFGRKYSLHLLYCPAVKTQLVPLKLTYNSTKLDGVTY